MKCVAITAKHKQCSRNALPNSEYCSQHLKIYGTEKKESKNESLTPEYVQLGNLVSENNKKYEIVKDWNINWKIDVVDKAQISKYVDKITRDITTLNTNWKNIIGMIYKHNNYISLNKELLLHRRMEFKLDTIIAQLQGITPPLPAISEPNNELINNKLFITYWSNFIPYLLFKSAIIKQGQIQIGLIAEYYNECKSTDTKITPREVQEIKTQFYNNIKLTTFICDIHNYLSIDLITRIHQWITNLDILSLREKLYIFDADITGLKSVFAIKVLQEPNTWDDKNLLHEMSVGLLITNKYRASIPNFSYIFGGFSCSHPKITEKETIQYCENLNNPVQYLLYEFIPGDTWRQKLRKWDNAQFLSALISITYALDYANKNDNYTHYDLHYDNIILRNPFGKMIGIPIIINNETRYIVSDEIPTIIDFGFSHYKYNNVDFGMYDLQYAGVFHNLCFPLFDIYKLLIVSATAVDKKSHLYELIAQLLTFFSNESISDLIKIQYNPNANLFANLPPTPKLLKLSNADFGTWILEHYKINNLIKANDIPIDISILQIDKNKLFI
jgi:hypothetical protein